MAVTRVEEYVEAGAIGALLLAGWGVASRSAILRWRHEMIARQDSRKAVRAATIAAQDREMFDPAYLQQAVRDMLEAAAGTWAINAPDPQGRNLDGALGRWAGAHFHGRGSRLHGGCSVALIRVVNREDPAEDRAVVRVRFAIRHGYKERASEPQVGRYDERWTLAHQGQVWRLIEFDAQPLADALLRAPQIAGSDQDTGRLSQQSLEELADTASMTSDVAGLTDPDASPYAQLLDLSLVNDRFAPAFIETTLQQLVEAWSESTAGSPRPLEARATGQIVTELLTPDPSDRSRRLILRDPTLSRWQPLSIKTEHPPEVSLTATVTAVRYLVDPTGAPVAGAPDIRHKLSMRWTVRLTDKHPSWQLVKTSNPAVEIPG